MSDMGRNKHLAPANSQPKLASYVDDAQLALERKRIFTPSSLYIGHEKSVPEVGDWRALTQENMGRVLVRTPSGLELVSNVCRHRQGLMLGNQSGWGNRAASNTGNLSETGGNIVCPLHRWTYNTQGQLLGAPHFPQTPCLNLERFTLNNCHGLHFEGQRNPSADMASLFKRPEFDFSNYVLDHVEVHPCHYNWKTFIEVYLEDYHVEPFHPGLGQFVSCDDLSWEFGKQFSLQRVGVHRALSQPGSDAYRVWHDKLLSFRQGQAPNFGAIWVTYFPTHMIELTHIHSYFQRFTPCQLKRPSTWSNFITQKKLLLLSVNLLKPSVRLTWKRQLKMMKLQNAWTLAVKPCSPAVKRKQAHTSHPWRMACSIS